MVNLKYINKYMGKFEYCFLFLLLLNVVCFILNYQYIYIHLPLGIISFVAMIGLLGTSFLKKELANYALIYNYLQISSIYKLGVLIISITIGILVWFSFSYGSYYTAKTTIYTQNAINLIQLNKDIINSDKTDDAKIKMLKTISDSFYFDVIIMKNNKLYFQHSNPQNNYRKEIYNYSEYIDEDDTYSYKYIYYSIPNKDIAILRSISFSVLPDLFIGPEDPFDGNKYIYYQSFDRTKHFLYVFWIVYVLLTIILYKFAHEKRERTAFSSNIKKMIYDIFSSRDEIINNFNMYEKYFRSSKHDYKNKILSVQNTEELKEKFSKALEDIIQATDDKQCKLTIKEVVDLIRNKSINENIKNGNWDIDYQDNLQAYDKWQSTYPQ